MLKPAPSIYLIGDTYCVQEFAALFHAGRFSLSGKLNRGIRGVRLPSYFKQSSSPPRLTTFALELTHADRETKSRNLGNIEKHVPRSTTILSSSITVTATEQAAWMKHPERMIGISALPTLISGKLIELAPTMHTHRESISRAGEMFAGLGKEVAVVQDRI